MWVQNMMMMASMTTSTDHNIYVLISIMITLVGWNNVMMIVSM